MADRPGAAYHKGAGEAADSFLDSAAAYNRMAAAEVLYTVLRGQEPAAGTALQEQAGRQCDQSRHYTYHAQTFIILLIS